MPKQTASSEPLVNQKSDDGIPFANEQNGDSTAPAAAPTKDESKQWDDRGMAELEVIQLRQRTLELEGDLSAAEDEILKLKQESEQHQADPGDASIKLQCFLAILSGQAAKGELSIGAVKGDEAVRLQMKHAAGMASFAEIAAKKL